MLRNTSSGYHPVPGISPGLWKRVPLGLSWRNYRIGWMKWPTPLCFSFLFLGAPDKRTWNICPSNPDRPHTPPKLLSPSQPIPRRHAPSFLRRRGEDRRRGGGGPRTGRDARGWLQPTPLLHRGNGAKTHFWGQPHSHQLRGGWGSEREDGSRGHDEVSFSAEVGRTHRLRQREESCCAYRSARGCPSPPKQSTSFEGQLLLRYSGVWRLLSPSVPRSR